MKVRTLWLLLMLIASTICCAAVQPAQKEKVVTPNTAETPYTVRIVFTGLMTYLPEKNGVTVIVPNVAKGFDEIGDDKHAVHPHMAYILSTPEWMPPAHELNDDHDFEPSTGDPAKYHYVAVEGEYITLDDENDVALLNAPLTFNNDDLKKPCPTTPGESSSLYWLSSMQRVHGGVVQAREDKYFDRRPKKKDVLARAQLRYGNLEAHVIKPGYIWDFRVPTASGPAGPVLHTQATAEEVHWTFQARGVPFVLNLLSYKDDLRRVAFEPDSNRQITIVIGHTPENETGPIAGSVQGFDGHYSVYHRFKKANDPGLGPVPHLQNVDGTKCADQTVLHDRVWKMIDPQTKFLVHSAHGNTFTGEPSPSTLACSGNTWP